MRQLYWLARLQAAAFCVLRQQPVAGVHSGKNTPCNFHNVKYCADVRIGFPCTGQALQPGVIQRPCELPPPPPSSRLYRRRVLQDVLRLARTACIEQANFSRLLRSRCNHSAFTSTRTWAIAGWTPPIGVCSCSLLKGQAAMMNYEYRGGGLLDDDPRGLRCGSLASRSPSRIPCGRPAGASPAPSSSPIDAAWHRPAARRVARLARPPHMPVALPNDGSARQPHCAGGAASPRTQRSWPVAPAATALPADRRSRLPADRLPQEEEERGGAGAV